VYGVTPPDGDEVKLSVLPTQIGLGVALAPSEKLGLTVTDEVVAVAVQPFASVTVTLYTPEWLVVTLERVGF
jgi:hypothetical protein